MIATAVITILTFLTLSLSILLFPSIKLGKIRIGTYWVTALAGALLLLCCGLVPLRTVWAALTDTSAINPLKILVLFFSMTFLSVLLDEVGLFRFLAKKATSVTGSYQFSLFVALYCLVSILTIFTSNDIMILTLTPFICFFCKNTRINPLPYLVSEFAAANTWSMMLIIGNPTNIYLATSAGIDFLSYLRVMLLPTIAAGLVEFALIVLVFRRQLKKKLETQEDDFVIKSKPDLVIGLIHLFVCLVFLVLSGYVHLEMWLISAACALSLLLCTVIVRFVRRDGWCYLTTSLKRLPWQLIPFVMSMFVIVICLGHQGISEELGRLLGDKACIWTYGASSFLAANLINNIPMSMLFSTLPGDLSSLSGLQAVFASVIGSNIGAFLTPIGALAGIMFTSLTERFGIRYGYREFIKYGVIIAVPTIVTALLVLSLVLR